MLDEIREKIEGEIEELLHELHVILPERIEKAVELGDLRENAEFQYAKEEQGHIEGRISEIAAKLGAAQVINIKEIAPSGRVIFGTTVRLLNVESDEEVTYKIVGDDEADIKQGTISIYSPVARSLVGKQVDDVVLIQIPSGKIEYEILSVEHL